ncbi:unnamed protein product [Echinostoma caproni]|uniref:Transposase n=1 Tax=Echinostoma caproni TaxID=27848 RepID=A0A183B7N1_9TREM|nr:unnamed protein product [Echinostoma caproni]
MVTLTPRANFHYGDHEARLVYRMRQMRIQPLLQQTPLAYLHHELAESSHFSIMAETLAFLQPQYSRPHMGLPRFDKAGVIERNGRHEAVNIGLLKSEHLTMVLHS